MKKVLAAIVTLFAFPANAATVLLDQVIAVPARDFDFKSALIPGCRVLRIEASNLQIDDPLKKIRLRVFANGRLLAASGDYDWQGHSIIAPQSGANKPVFDSDNDEVNGTDADGGIDIHDNPLRAFPDTDFNAMITIPDPGSSATAKAIYYSTLSFDNDGRQANDHGGAFAFTPDAIDGFRFYTSGSSKIIAGRIIAHCD